jgi:hypothetical protein
MDSPIKKEKSFFDISCNIKEINKCKETVFPFLSYIEYKIFFTTNKKKWRINKRFKDFDNLHLSLQKMNVKNLPKLPQKTLFNSDKIVEERKIKLNKYLNSLLLRDDIYNIDPIFNFIELKKEDYLLMKESSEENFNQSNSPMTSYSRSTAATFKSLLNQKNKEDTVIKKNFFYSLINNDEEENEFKNSKILVKKSINDFLNELNSKKNQSKSVIVDEFKNDFFDKTRKKIFTFHNEDIYKLFYGDRSAKKFGLLYHCGDVKNNILGAEKCVGFLSSLLDFEFNLESEDYCNILKLAKLDVLKQMNFKLHLTSGKPFLFSSCCRIIRKILNEEKKINLKNLLNDEELEKKVNESIKAFELMEKNF